MKRILHGALICALIVGVSIALWPASVSAASTAIYVDDDFLDDPSRHMWDTIQEGIYDADNGTYDTVYVYAGTYTENIVVDKSTLTIQGELSSLVTVDGQGSGYTIHIAAEDVRVRQLKIIGGAPAGVYWGNVANGVLEKCDITDNAIGVALQSLVNQTIECNQIHDNTGDGIEVRASELKDLTLNDISYNRDGISLYDSSKITIWYNKSYNSSNYGIYVDEDSHDNDIYLNDFSDNTAGDGYQELAADNNWETPNKPEWDGYCYGGFWYSSMRGNYWGDYGGIDNDPIDGIGDTAYTLGSEADDFPLISSYTNYPMGTTCPGSPVPECKPEQAPPNPPAPATQNPPSNLTATAVSSSQIDLIWQDNSDDELGFRIERKVEGDATYSLIDTVGAGVTSYTHSDVVEGTTYHYRVLAYSPYGDSPYSNVASATTAEGDRGGGCFIATAAYGTASAAEIDVLRAFRDEVLLESTLGSQFVAWYYQTSPPVADFISENNLLRTVVRELVIDPMVSVATFTQVIWGD